MILISVEIDPKTGIHENLLCISDILSMAEMADNTVLLNLNILVNTVSVL